MVEARAGAQAAQEDVSGADVSLMWDAPAECPGEQWVREEIERLIGRPLGTGETPTLMAQATVKERKEGAWRLRLRTMESGSKGLRELESSDCTTLAEAAALILALSIDPRAVVEKRRATAGKDAQEQTLQGKSLQEQTAALASREAEVADLPGKTPAPGADSEEALPESVTRRPIRLRLTARLDALGDIGTQPHAGLGIGAAVGLELNRLRMEGSFSFWPARQGEPENLPELGGELALLAGAAGCCYRVWGDVLSLAPCAHLELGSMYGKGINVTHYMNNSALWLALLATGRATWQITNWAAFGLELGLAAPLLRPNYTLQVQGGTERVVVHRPSALAPRIRLGIELKL